MPLISGAPGGVGSLTRVSTGSGQAQLEKSQQVAMHAAFSRIVDDQHDRNAAILNDRSHSRLSRLHAVTPAAPLARSESL